MQTLSISLMLLFLWAGALAGQDSVFVSISGDTATVWNTNARENCVARFQFSVAWIDSSHPVITETDTVAMKGYCFCTYDFSVVLAGLKTGHYSADIYRQYLRQYGYDRDTTLHIGLVGFDIVGSQSSTYSELFFQSDCRQTTSVEAELQHRERFELRNNFPNPFNPTTSFCFQIPVTCYVTLRVFDVLGEEVATLVSQELPAGTYTPQWDAKTSASGVYFYRLQAGTFFETKKLILIR